MASLRWTLVDLERIDCMDVENKNHERVPGMAFLGCGSKIRMAGQTKGETKGVLRRIVMVDRPVSPAKGPFSNLTYSLGNLQIQEGVQVTSVPECGKTLKG
ncbi:hypothetical protein N7462_003628 [Penicillium macrosclerotiorum]|uniref:uncharacterized protein n=1 Tax=Penicillium macrosclerotiorum TaxID=303699 RepID=UPI002548FCB1|nr:uncharacterized protein N7462_003628 [Penicillium macrosclerotiorum]KAJ5689236.1 hypothetical protein N7462_003628 [Penicillium macrosclerotiorum]